MKDLGKEYEIIIIIRKGAIIFASKENPPKPEVGDTVLTYFSKYADEKNGNLAPEKVQFKGMIS